MVKEEGSGMEPPENLKLRVVWEEINNRTYKGMGEEYPIAAPNNGSLQMFNPYFLTMFCTCLMLIGKSFPFLISFALR